MKSNLAEKKMGVVLPERSEYLLKMQLNLCMGDTIRLCLLEAQILSIMALCCYGIELDLDGLIADGNS
jgi:hypothetical protein